MFTGIVEEVGTVRQRGPCLVVEATKILSDTGAGSSIAVNGVCLTAVEVGEGVVRFDLSPETLARSGLGRLAVGGSVNLERPVTLLTRLGGHLVQGHVDGVGRVASVEPDDGSAVMVVTVPDELQPYVVGKGSIAVDGVSLTVSDVTGDRFAVALVPFTLTATTLGSVKPGDDVNLEVDVVAKYVESFMRRTR